MTLNVRVGEPEQFKTQVGAVKVENAVLDDLEDVDATLPSHGDVLQYSDIAKLWVAGPLPEETEIDGGTF